MRSSTLIFALFVVSIRTSITRRRHYGDIVGAVVHTCYDGDTCTSSKGETIRLACIDTPELKGKHANPTSAKSAKNFLNELVAYQEVSIKRITKDRYGRTVAELFKDEENIQELIVKKGFGVIYKKYSHQCDWSKNS